MAVLFCLWILQSFAPIAQAQAIDQDIGSGSLTLRDEQLRAIDAPRMQTAVRMKVSGIVARVEVSQRFHNASDAWVEGLYAFPLPEHAAVDSLRMKVGERIIVGEIREKEQAQKIFEQARQQGDQHPQAQGSKGAAKSGCGHSAKLGTRRRFDHMPRAGR